MKVNLGYGFQAEIGKGFAWVRVFGKLVFHAKDVNRHPLVYSQRLQDSRREAFYIGKWRVVV